MTKQYWLTFFIAALLTNIIGINADNDLLQYISKPLIVPALAGYFIRASRGKDAGLEKYIAIALLFSWLGDVLLMFQPKAELFFLLGLSAFLLAHIAYIIFFQRLRINEKISIKTWLVIAVAIYYASLIYLLLPYLRDMKIPVLVYGIVISCMLLLAMHTLFIKNKLAGQWMMVGALLFVLSDSILAVNKFYQPFEAAGVLIMLTYGLAQWFIVKGAVNYISSADKR